MMQQILLSLVSCAKEGNPQPVFANTEKLNDAVEELRRCSITTANLKGWVKTSYVWLNMENGTSA